MVRWPTTFHGPTDHPVKFNESYDHGTSGGNVLTHQVERSFLNRPQECNFSKPTFGSWVQHVTATQGRQGTAYRHEDRETRAEYEVGKQHPRARAGALCVRIVTWARAILHRRRPRAIVGSA